MWRTLRSVWTERAVPVPLDGNRWDRVVVGVVVLVAVVDGAVHRDPVGIAFGVATAGAVLIRRAHPLAAVAIGFGGLAVLDTIAHLARSGPVVLWASAAVLLLAYALLRWGSGRQVLLGSAVMATTFVVAVLTDPSGVADALGGATVLLVAVVLGLSTRYRAASRAHVVDQIKMAERNELARELHDTVAHHVSAIAIQAQAGLQRARSGSPADAVEALAVIEREAARTLVEMRRMVGALRADQGHSEPGSQRGLADVARLASNGSPGLRVDVALRGELDDLAPTLDAALYRVAQEAVTNARRHADRATRVEVCVTGGVDRVDLTVVDDGVGTAAGSSAIGYGIVGMSERIALLGGAFEAGRGADGGFSVRAVLPRRGGAR